MIVRVLTARVPDRHAAAFEDVLRKQLPLMREYDGLVYVKLARQSHDGYEDVLLFEEWRDATALYGWAGENIMKPRLLPGAEGLAERVEVTHYEALDVDPDALFASRSGASGASGVAAAAPVPGPAAPAPAARSDP